MTRNDILTEEITMTTSIEFELNSIKYSENNGRYYKTEGGKKTRVSKAAYEEAAAEWTEMVKGKAEQDAEQDEIDTITAEMTDKPVEPTKAKKQSKPRKSKDIAHESKYGVTLTAKQVDFLRHLPDSDFWENGLNSEIWVDCLCDEIGGQFSNKPMTVGAMISTLCEKKLGVRCRQKVNGRMATSFKLTDLGKMVVSELGIY